MIEACSDLGQEQENTALASYVGHADCERAAAPAADHATVSTRFSLAFGTHRSSCSIVPTRMFSRSDQPGCTYTCSQSFNDHLGFACVVVSVTAWWVGVLVGVVIHLLQLLRLKSHTSARLTSVQGSSLALGSGLAGTITGARCFGSALTLIAAPWPTHETWVGIGSGGEGLGSLSVRQSSSVAASLVTAYSMPGQRLAWLHWLM